MLKRLSFFTVLMGSVMFFQAMGCGGSNSSPVPVVSMTLTVDVSGAGTGTVTSNAGGISCTNTGGTCSADYTLSSPVTLTATPDAGYVFHAWIGSTCTGTVAANCNLAVTADTTIQASFTPIIFSSNRSLDGLDNGAATTVQNIWLVKTDGTGLTALTQSVTPSVVSYWPEWSPDGTQIIFSSNRNLDASNNGVLSTSDNIWLMNADGSGLTPLTQATQATSAYPKWSPNGQQIAFESDMSLTDPDPDSTPNDATNIWLMNADGTNQDALTSVTTPSADSTNLQWSPNGQQIVFASFRNLDESNSGALSSQNIWVIDVGDLDLQSLTQVTAVGVSSDLPQWSSNGNNIVFSSNRNLDETNTGAPNLAENIWVMSSEGIELTALTEVTSSGADSVAGTWNPTGTAIAYRSLRNLDGTNTGSASTTSNVWLVNLSGVSDPLTELSLSNAQRPKWSTDGSVITYSSDRNLSAVDSDPANLASNIWTMSANGANTFAVTESTTALVQSIMPIW